MDGEAKIFSASLEPSGFRATAIKDCGTAKIAKAEMGPDHMRYLLIDCDYGQGRMLPGQSTPFGCESPEG
jgi:hypothetical protein